MANPSSIGCGAAHGNHGVGSRGQQFADQPGQHIRLAQTRVEDEVAAPSKKPSLASSGSVTWRAETSEGAEFAECARR